MEIDYEPLTLPEGFTARSLAPSRSDRALAIADTLLERIEDIAETGDAEHIGDLADALQRIAASVDYLRDY